MPSVATVTLTRQQQHMGVPIIIHPVKYRGGTGGGLTVAARYLDTREIPLAELTPFPGNARRGNVEVIAESLVTNGQYKSITVRDHPTGALVILAGNHTTKAVAYLSAMSADELETRYGDQLRRRLARAEEDADTAAEYAAELGNLPESELAERATAAEADPRDLLGDAADLAAEATARVDAARAALAGLRGWSGRDTIRCEVIQCDDAEARRINLADNRTAELATDDPDDLRALLAGLDGDFTGTGWAEDDYLSLLADAEPEPESGGGGGDELPAPPKEPRTKPGDLYLLGPHCRLLCGDSTDAASVARLLAGETAVLIHADPPYGMGKESDGIANDNLHGANLDAFQMAWWKVWAGHLAGNGSAYIWGNAPDLWRLWYSGGLSGEPDLMVRNEIVWDKGSTPGMASEGSHSYPVASERCLFLMRGTQFLGNQNKDEFWEGYEPLRAWMSAQRDQAGWSNKDVNDLTGTQMAGHWFGRSQFHPISEKHYAILAQAAAGRAFTKNYGELFREMFPSVRDGGNSHRRELAATLRQMRTRFDGTHDAMTDVWQFGRVVGEERYGHATPKPAAMITRVIKTSTEPGDLIAVPFGGTGPEFTTGHFLRRRVAGMELKPEYCDIIAARFQEATGILPLLERDDGTTVEVDFTEAG